MIRIDKSNLLVKATAVVVLASLLTATTGCGSSSSGANLDGASESTEVSQSDPGTKPSSPSASISKGGDASRFCSGNTACRFVRVTVGALDPPYSITMYDDYGGSGESVCEYTTSESESENCYFGFPGYQVYVIVNGVWSNTLTW